MEGYSSQLVEEKSFIHVLDIWHPDHFDITSYQTQNFSHVRVSILPNLNIGEEPFSTGV